MEHGWARTRSSRRWVRAGWARSIGRGIRASAETSRSRCCRRRSRRTPTACGASSRRRGPPAVLNHPNITAVYDIGQHDGAPYVVSELLEGETLRARLSGGAIAVRKAIDYAVQIAQGSRGGARERDRPPGPEAREPVPDERRAGEDPRLRPREADAARRAERAADEPSDGRSADGAGRRHGDARVHVARAGEGQARGPAIGPVLLRRDPLRDALGRPRVPPRLGGRNHVGDPARGAAGSLGDEQERPAGSGADRAALPGEEPGGAVLLGARPRLRSRGALGPVRNDSRRVRRGPVGAPAASSRIGHRGDPRGARRRLPGRQRAQCGGAS